MSRSPRTSRIKVLWAKEFGMVYSEFLNDLKLNDRLLVKGDIFVKPWHMEGKTGATASLVVTIIERAVAPARGGIRGCTLRQAPRFDAGRNDKSKIVKALQAKIDAEQQVDRLNLSKEAKDIILGETGGDDSNNKRPSQGDQVESGKKSRRTYNLDEDKENIDPGLTQWDNGQSSGSGTTGTGKNPRKSGGISGIKPMGTKKTFDLDNSDQSESRDGSSDQDADDDMSMLP